MKHDSASSEGTAKAAWGNACIYGTAKAEILCLGIEILMHNMGYMSFSVKKWKQPWFFLVLFLSKQKRTRLIRPQKLASLHFCYLTQNRFLYLIISFSKETLWSAFFILAKTVLKSVKNKILFELACRHSNEFVTVRPWAMNAACGVFILFSFLNPFWR